MPRVHKKEGSENNSEREKPTPLPARQLTILCIVLLTESICSTMLIPFVGLYVSFMMNWSSEKAGYTAGCLVGLFMLGQVISGKQWGRISETFGRKFAIVLGVTFCAISVFFFGLSSNIYLCCLWRFLHGIMAGCSLAAKAVIADVTDHTNQSSGFALVSLTWGVGTLIGPTVGGLFYDPAHQTWLSFLNLKQDGFWVTHPAFLPSLMAAVYNSFAIVVCVLFLEETNKEAKPLRTKLPHKIEARLRPCFRYLQPKVIVEKDPMMRSVHVTDVVIVDADKPNSTNSKDNREDQGFSITLSLNQLANDLFNKLNPIADTGDGRRKDANSSNSPTAHAEQGTAEHPLEDFTEILSLEPSQLPAKRKSFGFKQAFSHPLTRGVCITSMLISGADMMFAETFPLWAIAPTQNGGLSLSSGDVGVLILVNSVPSVISNVYFSRILSWFRNPMLFWCLTQLFYGSLNLLFPCVTNLSTRPAFWCTMLLGLTRKVFESWTFATLMVVVARSAPKGYVSIMYGIQQSVSCFVRCIVPFTFAPLFAWSISQPHTYPFNHHFTFILSLIPLLFSAALCIKLKLPDPPTEVNKNNDKTLTEAPPPQDADRVSNQPLSWASELHGDEGNNLFVNNSFVVLSSSFANPVASTLPHSAAVSDHANDQKSSNSSFDSQLLARENSFTQCREFSRGETPKEEGFMLVNSNTALEEELPVAETPKIGNPSSGTVAD